MIQYKVTQNDQNNKVKPKTQQGEEDNNPQGDRPTKESDKQSLHQNQNQKEGEQNTPRASSHQEGEAERGTPRDTPQKGSGPQTTQIAHHRCGGWATDGPTVAVTGAGGSLGPTRGVLSGNLAL